MARSSLNGFVALVSCDSFWHPNQRPLSLYSPTGIKRMKKSALLVFALLAPLTQAEPAVKIVTNLGTMSFELDASGTPQTVQRFQQLASAHWYEGKTFYRVVKGHVIQAGIKDDDHPDMEKYKVPGEFNGHFKHKRGCLGMARGESPDSGGTEFYICDQDRPHLDGRYAVFGRMIDGEAVLDAIANQPVEEVWLDNPGGKPVAFHQPKQQVTIERIELFDTKK